MNEDDLKRYTVKVHDGSGCLFQPLKKDEYTYILTAKHIFFSDEKDGRKVGLYEIFSEGQEVEIWRNIQIYNGWTETKIEFVYKKDKNIFFHNNADAAILKIDHIEGFNKICIIDNLGDNFLLSGFPGPWKVNTLGERQTNTQIQRISVGSGNYFNYAELNFNFPKEQIGGLSGGPIVRLSKELIELGGIQSRMANSNWSMGQIGYIPMHFFDKIIALYPLFLKELTTNFLVDFTSVSDDAFNFNVNILNKIAVRFKEILNLFKVTKQDEFVKPYMIKDVCKEKYTFLTKSDLHNPKYYRFWLEILVIQSIFGNDVIEIERLKDTMKKLKVLFSDSDQDFWAENLQKLHTYDYSELDDDAKIIVGSNCSAAGGGHILNIDSLKNIGADIYNYQKIKREYLSENKKVVSDIGSYCDYPLEKYKFINISAFKEGIIDLLSDNFEDEEDFNILISLIKQAYEGQHN